MRASKTWVNLIGLLLLAVLGIAQGAFAQPQVTRGGALKRRQYQTYAAATYYVDPTGNDANTCTSSGTDACLTIQGAVNKLPRFIRHAVSINVAAGTYTGAVSIGPGLHIDDGVGSLSITGVFGPFPVATGNNAGTTTSSVAGSSAGPSSITDTGQAWTSNNLTSAFVTFTSGTLSGKTFPITSNTATSLSFPSATSAGTGAVYSITTPASVLNPTLRATIQGVTGSGSLIVANLGIAPSGGQGAIIFTRVSSRISLVASDLRSSTAAATVSGSAGSIAITTTRVVNSSNGAAVTVGGAYGIVTFASVVSSFLSSSTGPAFSTTGGSASGGMISAVLTSGTSSTNPLLSFDNVTPGSAGVTLTNIWVTCTGAGIGVGYANPPAGPQSVSSFNFGTSRVTGCAVGVQTGSRSQISVTANVVFDTCTTALNAVKGGMMAFTGATPTFTGVTNELQLDNSDNYTFSTLSSLPTPQVISNSYGSTFIR